MPDTVNTVTGPIRVEQLGTTLMHEHLVIGYSGENADGLESSTSRADRIAICVDQVHKLQDHGIASMLDPCPSNLGRDMDLAGEVGARTGFQIVMATGLYRELEDAPGDDDSMAERIADLFMKELEDGVGDAGVKPGVIKVGTYEESISPYEYEVLRAAAIASKATDACSPVASSSPSVCGSGATASAWASAHSLSVVPGVAAGITRTAGCSSRRSREWRMRNSTCFVSAGNPKFSRRSRHF